MAAFFCVYLLLIAFTIWRSMRRDTQSKVTTFTAGFKLLVTYLQTTGTLHTLFPELDRMPQTLFLSMGKFSTLQFSTAALMCLLDGFAGRSYQIFYAYMCFPLLAVPIAAVVIYYNSTLGCMPSERRVLLHPEIHSKIRSRLITKDRAAWQIFITSLTALIYFLYPTLMSRTPATTRGG